MRRLWPAWVALLSRQERGDTLAIFRIALGAVILYSLLSVLAADLIDVLWVHSDHGGLIPVRGNWLLEWLGGPKPSVVWPLYWACLAVAVAFTAGLGGRLTAFVLMQLYLALVSINHNASGGYDSLIANALWLLVLGRATATLSVDCWLRNRSWQSKQRISSWPRYLLIFQLIVLYTATGWQKMSLVWTPAGGYSALYWVMSEPTWVRFQTEIFASRPMYFLLQVGTAITWHWEQSAPLLLLVYYFRYTRERAGRIRRWFNRFDLRRVWMAIGLALHVGILMLLNVGPFSWITLAYYICLWRPVELRAFASRLARLRQRH